MAVERVYEEPHTRLLNSLIRDPDLTDAEYRVFSELLSYRWQGESCFPGQARIAAEIGKSERGVRYALQELEKKGLIARRRRGQRYSDEYTFPERHNMPLPNETQDPLDRQILPFPIELDRQNLPPCNPDRQNTTTSDRQILPPNKDSVEKDSVVGKAKRPVNPVIALDDIEDEEVRAIAVALEYESLKQKEINRIRKEVDRPIYAHLDPVRVAEGYVAWQETKPEKQRDKDRVSAFIHQLDYKRTFPSYFKDSAPRPNRPGYSVSSTSSNGGSSPTDYVKWDAKIEAELPEVAGMLRALRDSGSCKTDLWEQLKRTRITVKDDRIILEPPDDDAKKSLTHSVAKRRIDCACRDVGMGFVIGCDA